MHHIIKKVFLYTAYTVCIFFFSSLITFGLFNYLNPLVVPQITPSTVVLDRHGNILRQFSDPNGIFRHWVELDNINPHYLNTLIRYEDRYFYQHFGINPLATFRAFGQFIKNRKIISGSSTLTMQVARLLYPHERSFMGKIEQVFRAIQLERALTKKEILTLYVNIAPMGGNIEGVQAASWRYFSKNANSLNISESALLVALPQRPSIYRPDQSLEKAKFARDKVLSRLATFDYLTKDDAERYKNEPINYTPAKTQFSAPLLADHLQRTKSNQHIIHTTIDGRLQRKIEKYLKIQSLNWPEKISTATLIINNHDHQVYAYIGSADLFDHDRFGYIDMVQAIRSPGSTLKPFAYGMAMDYGIIHEASLLTDVKRGFDGYFPKNFDGNFHGAIPMFKALQMSLNVPVVQVFQHLQPHYFVKKLRDANIKLLVDTPTLSIILGGVGISLWEQVRLFSSLATEGKVYPLQVIPSNISEPHTILSPEAAWIIHKVLSNVRPTDRFNPRKIAWKTGTSYGYRDGWAIGVTADWTVGTWIGRPDGVPNVGALANRYATPLLFDIFNFLPKDKSIIDKPYGVQPATICWPSGRKISEAPTDSCLEQYDIDTIQGKTPPTLYDSIGETPHSGWPKSLNIGDIPTQSVQIITLQNESIIFKSPYTIALNAQGNPPFLWYLDSQLLLEPELDIQNLSNGIHTLSVQDSLKKVDKITFEIQE